MNKLASIATNFWNKINNRRKQDVLFNIFCISTFCLFWIALFCEVFIAEFKPGSLYLMGMVVSLYANICLYLLIFAIFRKLGVVLKRMELIITLCIMVISVTMLLYSVMTRRYLYFWDYHTYYNLTLDLLNNYTNGFFRGTVKVWLSSYDDYSSFISLFTMFFFGFTTHTNNAFCGSLGFTVLCPFILVATGLIKKTYILLGVKGKSRIFATVFALGSLLCMPHLYFSIYHSMPDMFGLVFALLIILLTCDYQFDKVDRERWFYIWFITICLIFSRRWYAFWVVAFYFIFALYVFFRLLVKRDCESRVCVKNLIIFGCISIIAAIIFLLPMVIRVVGSNYVADYSSWKFDTLSQNFVTHFKHIGFVLVSLILVGYVIGILKTTSRQLAIINLACWFLPLCLFHRIQSADYHQLLMLAPSTIVGIILFSGILFSLRQIILQNILGFIILGFSIVNMMSAFYPPYKKAIPFVSDTSLLLDNRTDDVVIDVINQWILQYCNTEENGVYMIPHNSMYCPDIFIWRNMPDRSIMNVLPYGADVLSLHWFPEQLLSARFIITAEPLGQSGGSMAPRINQVVHELLPEGVFSEIERFDMGNGYNIVILERQRDVTTHEIDKYLDAFADVISLYPDHYAVLFDWRNRITADTLNL